MKPLQAAALLFGCTGYHCTTVLTCGRMHRWFSLLSCIGDGRLRLPAAPRSVRCGRVTMLSRCDIGAFGRTAIALGMLLGGTAVAASARAETMQQHAAECDAAMGSPVYTVTEFRCDDPASTEVPVTHPTDSQGVPIDASLLTLQQLYAEGPSCGSAALCIRRLGLRHMEGLRGEGRRQHVQRLPSIGREQRVGWRHGARFRYPGNPAATGAAQEPAQSSLAALDDPGHPAHDRLQCQRLQ